MLLLLLAIVAAVGMAISIIPAQNTITTAGTTTNTCVLYGATSWAGISILVIVLSLLIVGAVFMLSGIFSNSTRAKIRQAAKSELTEAFISAVILVILAGAALGACSISTSIGNSLHVTTTTANPFQYSEYYIGNLSTNTGLNLLTTIYSISVSYAIEAQVLQSLGTLFNTNVNTIYKQISSLFLGNAAKAVGLSIGIAAVSHSSILFSLLSSTYVDIIAPLVTIAIGLLFIQFIMLPFFQYTAFAVILPVAIAMRSLAFMGTNLRAASNTVLAVAIAAYIIYPLMIAFNSYAIAWIFSGANPSFQYVHTTYVVPNIPVSNYFKSVPSSGIFGSAFNIMVPFVTSAFSQSGGFIINPFTVASQGQMIVNETAQFIFTSVIMIVIDLAVTIGFAAGLTKALNSGIEGAGSFWAI